MAFELIALLCTGLFAGAAIYVTLVEHPARVGCGPVLAIAEFRPSYRRGALMQAGLASIGCVTAVAAFTQGRGAPVLVAGLLLGAAILFTLIVILPTNKPPRPPSRSVDGGGRDLARPMGSSSRRAQRRRWRSLSIARSPRARGDLTVQRANPQNPGESR